MIHEPEKPTAEEPLVQTPCHRRSKPQLLALVRRILRNARQDHPRVQMRGQVALDKLQNVGLEDQEFLADFAVGGVVLFAGTDEEALEVCRFGGLVGKLTAEIRVFSASFLKLPNELVVSLPRNLGSSSSMLDGLITAIVAIKLKWRIWKREIGPGFKRSTYTVTHSRSRFRSIARRQVWMRIVDTTTRRCDIHGVGGRRRQDPHSRIRRLALAKRRPSPAELGALLIHCSTSMRRSLA